MTTLATRPQNGAITTADQLWNAEQKRELKQLIVKSDVSDAQLAVFAEVCQRTGLDPFLKQIYLVVGRGGIFTHIGVDGLRAIALQSGEFDSQDGPYWCGQDGVWRDVWLENERPSAARVGVKRLGSSAYTYAVVTFREFKGTGPNWDQKAAHMLAIRAEGHALRKVFQRELAGTYKQAAAVPGVRVTVTSDEAPELPPPADDVPMPEDTDAPTDAEWGTSPTLDELRAEYKEISAQARKAGIGHRVPSAEAGTTEWVDAITSLRGQIEAKAGK